MRIGGVLLWRREAIGYVVAGGLLLQATAYVMGSSAIDLLSVIVTGVPTGGPERASSWIVLSAIGLTLFTFFVLFVRSVVSSRRAV